MAADPHSVASAMQTPSTTSEQQLQPDCQDPSNVTEHHNTINNGVLPSNVARIAVGEDVVPSGMTSVPGAAPIPADDHTTVPDDGNDRAALAVEPVATKKDNVGDSKCSIYFWGKKSQVKFPVTRQFLT